MRKILLFLFLFYNLTAFSNTSKKIIIALSLNDCANCTLALYKVNEVLNKPQITFIFKSELEPDSLLVNKRTGINNYKSRIVKYSDDLYNKYTVGIRSTVNVVENDKTIYSSPLLELNAEELLSIYSETKESTCFHNLKSGEAKYIQNDNTLIIYNTQLKRWSYYDSLHQLDFTADEEWVKMVYNIYYKNLQEADEKYKVFEAIVKQVPNILPEIKRSVKTNSKELTFLTEISFINSNNETKEIDVSKKLFLISFNIEKKSFNSIKYINENHSLLNNKYFVNGNYFYYIDDNSILLPLYTNGGPIAESKYLSVFEINENNPNELILRELITRNIPRNYIKYNLKNNFHSYLFNKSLVLLRYGEFVYDLKKETEYKIPFPESEFNVLSNILSNALKTGRSSGYFINDIFDNGQTILLLYKDSSLRNLKLIEFEKKTEKLKSDMVLLTASELEHYTHRSSFSFNKNGKIQYLDNNNCISEL